MNITVFWDVMTPVKKGNEEKGEEIN